MAYQERKPAEMSKKARYSYFMLDWITYFTKRSDSFCDSLDKFVIELKKEKDLPDFLKNEVEGYLTLKFTPTEGTVKTKYKDKS